MIKNWASMQSLPMRMLPPAAQWLGCALMADRRPTSSKVAVFCAVWVEAISNLPCQTPTPTPASRSMRPLPLRTRRAVGARITPTICCNMRSQQCHRPDKPCRASRTAKISADGQLHFLRKTLNLIGYVQPDHTFELN